MGRGNDPLFRIAGDDIAGDPDLGIYGHFRNICIPKCLVCIFIHTKEYTAALVPKRPPDIDHILCPVKRRGIELVLITLLPIQKAKEGRRLRPVTQIRADQRRIGRIGNDPVWIHNTDLR